MRFLGVLGCQVEDAEDVAQEALLRWHRDAGAPRDEGAAQRWLFTVARRLFIDRFHRGRREVEVWSQRVEAQVLETWRGERGDLWVDAARDCVRRLPRRTGELVLRFYRDGVSRRQLAAEFGMTENGIKTALQRARAALRECIQHHAALAEGDDR